MARDYPLDPVTITPSRASIPLVEGCSDGAYGSFAVWQEGSPTGLVRVQHVLPTGDLDPAWPAAGAIACNIAAARTELGVVPDRLGGVYLMWKEGNSLYVSRLDPGGAVAAGWPARGRFLGGVFTQSPRPMVIEDGENGIYAAFRSSTSTALAIHLGPANSGAGGWPNSTRAVSVADIAYNTIYWPQVALAPDGGLFVAYAVSSNDEEAAPSAWRMRRLTSAGISAAGWPVEGMSFGSFQRDLLGSPANASLIALSPDGRGGVFLSIGNPVGSDPNGALLESRLYRLEGSGAVAAGWPVEGKLVSQGPYNYSPEFGPTPDYSYRVFPDAPGGGAVAGYPQFGLHNGSNVSFARCDDSGDFDQGFVAGASAVGNEVASSGHDGHFVASFYPRGPMGPYEPYAFLAVSHTSNKSNQWSEVQFGCCNTWYGDIGLAATEDGGAVFFWSQMLDRVGLFARRFNASGQVTAVEPGNGAAEPGLSRLRFVPGVGVRAAIELAGTGPTRFELYDVAGRRIASQPVELWAMRAFAPPDDVTLSGTADLRSGLYFGRLVQGTRSIAAKVMVAR